ncbi:MAG: histidinol-phosphate transaminase [Opitutaceae bacterium]|nr:histidinol-phosphate transaminase [Opitutaceae bacterium]
MSERTIADLVQPHISKLKAYTPGDQPEGSEWIKLNTNENPYPPSPKVSEAIRELDANSLRLYPDPKSLQLREAIAAHHSLEPNQVIIGNGSDDILNLLIRAFGGVGGTVGFSFPSYSLYPVLIGIGDGVTEIVDFQREMYLPVEQVRNSSAGLFLLTSPNAPTGVGFKNEKIEEVLKVHSGLFVVDEAYADFADETAIALLKKYPRLVITRTFSKSYSLAGIRVGYALAAPEAIDFLDRVRDSYNVSRLSQVAALAALEDQTYFQRVVAQVKETRMLFQAELKEKGWFVYPSQANFLFLEPKNSKGESNEDVATSLFDYLYSEKILVRYFGSHVLTSSFLRITLGTESEMKVLSKAINSWQTIV